MLFRPPSLDEREHAVLQQIMEAKEKLRWQLHEPRRWAGSLRRLSFARAIQGSNSIEGYDAALDDAAAVAMGEEPLDAGTETRRALEGYRDAMTYVLQLANETDFEYSGQLIKSLHFMMTSYALDNRPGRWRAGSIYVRKEETGEIVHEGSDVDLVPELMRELVEHLNQDNELPDLVRAGMAHLNMVMIHPFRDGNGRMARCLQSLVIARSGVLSPVFMSIEEYLGRNAQQYYDVLAEVGGGTWQPQRDPRPWVRFTLTAHLRQARTMLQRARDSELLWDQLERLATERALGERCVSALFDAALGMRIRNATYRAIFEDGITGGINEQTATRDLRQLVNANLLVPRGEKRGRYYVAGKEIVALMREVVAARNPRDETDPFAPPK
ncbi:MAG TPA: Fic family protein [Mycobacteriales bacterium]|nr:Fic family protein [Mycobacteriales bacterium]